MSERPERDEGGPTSDDAAWEDLVRRLQATDSSPARHDDDAPGAGHDPRHGPGHGAGHAWSDDGAPGAGRPAEPGAGRDLEAGGADAASRSAGPAGGPGSGPRDWDAAPPDDDFVPPEPDPVLAGDPSLVLGWIAAVGLPVLMVLLVVLLPSRVPPLGWIVLIAASLAAWLYLAWRLPRERKDDGDDGARV